MCTASYSLLFRDLLAVIHFACYANSTRCLYARYYASCSLFFCCPNTSLLAVFPIFYGNFTNALAVYILTPRTFSCLYTFASATYIAALAPFLSERVFVYNAQVGVKLSLDQ